jgi:3-deoxy-D-manno-octulosonate 8-phosphate phosphatase (KDO 8-P phosphatase)
MQEIYNRARSVRVAVFDVDGVLTDGALYYTDPGAEMKAFSVRDGHGIRMLGENGVAAAIITSRSSGALAARARNLGIELLYQGASDKLAAFDDLLGRCRVGAEACVYVGDDLVDVPVMQRCGLAVAVSDAPAPVRRVAQYVTRARGGRGAVREICEIILHAQGSLGTQLPPGLAERRAAGSGG